VLISGRTDIGTVDLSVVQDIADATEAEVRQCLPELEEQLRLVVQLSARVIPETGDAGASIAPGTIAWTADPSHVGGVAGVADRHLRHTLFHEMHHLVRGWTFYGGRQPTGFMEGVVSEGLATVFARDAAGDKAPWSEYPDEVTTWVGELIELPPDANYSEWMFLHPDGRRWIGYKAGTYIVDRAVEAAKTTAAALVRTPWEEILRLAELGGD